MNCQPGPLTSYLSSAQSPSGNPGCRP
jgi:hypothetical protein